jgi:protein phosphatase
MEKQKFGIIGDLQGCVKELSQLLYELGFYVRKPSGAAVQDGEWINTEHRHIIFAGDLNDRGPDSLGCIKIAMNLYANGNATIVRGNHDDKLRRRLKNILAGKSTSQPGKHGLEETVKQITDNCDREQIERIHNFLSSTPLVYENEDFIVVHGAYVPEARHTGRWESLCLYGQTTGQTLPNGLPERSLEWAHEWSETGDKPVFRGHDPYVEPHVIHGSKTSVIGIDTGACFGNKLSAYLWPEMTILSVPAEDYYSMGKSDSWQKWYKEKGIEWIDSTRHKKVCPAGIFNLDRDLPSEKA